MASATYSHQLNAAQLRAVIMSPQGGVARDLMRRGFNVETAAKRNLAGGATGPKRINKGRLVSSITTAMVSRNGSLAVIIGTNVFYARFVHDGTGVYGPLNRMIRPRNAKVLRFQPKGSGVWVYAREVRGMQANRFLLLALPAARD